MIAVRALIFNIGFDVLTAAISAVGLPILLGPRRWVAAYSRLWVDATLWWLRWSVGLDHEIRGRENLPSGPFILALKHQSAWDTVILGGLVPEVTIVAKRELLWLPLVGLYVLRGGAIMIDRKAGAAALRRLVAEARVAVAEGRSIAIFPEGTRTRVGDKQPYHAGVGALYSQLGIPIVPVALNSGRYWGRKAFMKRPGRIEVEILPPIMSGLDRRGAIALLEEQIETATARLIKEAVGRSGSAMDGARPVDKMVDSIGRAP